MEMIIEWGPERKHDGSGECPAYAREVPCTVRQGSNYWYGQTGKIAGLEWHWPYVTAYRLPAAVTAPAADLVRDALVAALKFYADPANYETAHETLPCDCCTDIFEPINRDKGEIARAALKEE